LRRPHVWILNPPHLLSNLEAPTPVTIAYLVNMALLGVYGAHRLLMIRNFHWRNEDLSQRIEQQVRPRVTVQLPLYNERTVAARLIQATGKLDYPADRLEIQVLDDSTDETRAVVDREIAKLVARGLDAKVLRRKDRVGYKAGALNFGMQSASGELLAIFDADFLPQPDFLLSLVPQFQDKGIGMVQARWDHINREESLLTRAQSTLLDGHFVIEHKVRHERGLFFNFNGTAGVWRRETIRSAGGWQHDTLTEDLDLSYRAQLAGWRFTYMPLVSAPAEVPPSISAFKSQQHRWAKGSIQVARKLGWNILRAKLPMRVKLEAAAHLSGNVGYPLVLLLAILLPLSVQGGPVRSTWWHMGFFALCTLSVVLFYDRSQQALGRRAYSRLRDVPAAVSLGIGMCASQTRAVLEGLFQQTGEFIRTPKRGDLTSQPEMGYRAMVRGLPGAELVLAAWFAWGLMNAVQANMWGSLPFLLLFFWSFAWVGSLSLRDWIGTSRPG
jgi:cellulose synthase/poly-beta-1,6-N-acetylglucosamine synthase-like glycosyltransferase